MTMMAQHRPDDARNLDFFGRAATPLAVLGARLEVIEANDALAGSVAGDGILGKSFASLLRARDRAHVEATLGELAAGESAYFEACWEAPVDPRHDSPLRFHVTRTSSESFMLAGIATPPQHGDEVTRMFSRALESAPLVLWATDAQGTYTMSAGKGLDLLGFRPGEQVGLNALDMFKDHADTARALVRALSGEESRVMNTLAPGVNFESWYMPMLAPDGSVEGVMGLGVDASERVKSEQDLREKLELIQRQSATIRALATPIIQVWDEVLCLPVIGTVDSARTADMMQGLLDAIVREQARYAIVDLTGVEVVDTSTADHLIQLFRAAKVLGVDGVLCGIRPAVAQTVVALGLELASVRTTRSLRDALKWCIRMRAAARARNGTRADGAPPANSLGAKGDAR
jgi:anti-anti-sigma regulatory factor/PAS domain-containing protein